MHYIFCASYSSESRRLNSKLFLSENEWFHFSKILLLPCSVLFPFLLCFSSAYLVFCCGKIYENIYAVINLNRQHELKYWCWVNDMWTFNSERMIHSFTACVLKLSVNIFMIFSCSVEVSRSLSYSQFFCCNVFLRHSHQCFFHQVYLLSSSCSSLCCVWLSQLIVLCYVAALRLLLLVVLHCISARYSERWYMKIVIY